jgi:hypothetical protein
MYKSVTELKRVMHSNSIKEDPNSISPQDTFNTMISSIETLNSLIGSFNLNEFTGIEEFMDRYDARRHIPNDILKYGIIVTYRLEDTQPPTNPPKRLWIIEQFVGVGIGDSISDESWKLIESSDISPITIEELDEITNLD